LRTCRSSGWRPGSAGSEDTMAVVNYAQKVINFKLVYYGPGLAGKTANLQHIHNSLPQGSTGKMISLAAGDDRTLFFDFLPVSALTVRGFTAKFQLYTVPGQVYYNMTRKLVLRGADGMVFVADSQWDRLRENVESFRNMEENLREYNTGLDEMPYVMQYNKRDLPNIAPLDYMEFLLNRRARRVPSFEAIAITGDGVFDTLNTVSRMVLAGQFGQEKGEHSETA
jgi:mutual gliding-motility protein MglA